MRLFACLSLVLALAPLGFASAAQPAIPQSGSVKPGITQRGTAQLAMAQPAIAPPLPARSTPVQPVVSPPVAARTATGPAITADPATLCETAVTTAAYVARPPPRLLDAISLTETGRPDPTTGRIRAWPWTINAENQGQFFDTKQEAIAAVQALQARGVRPIDVGCLQVNLMYHPDAFASQRDAFDPRANANYAARFLNALYAGSKDWAAAIAGYHSEIPALGDAYRVLVMARWRNGDPRPPGAAPVAYGDFTQSGKAYDDRAYGAFAPATRVYGAFAPRLEKRHR
jgi:hypothetical protein